MKEREKDQVEPLSSAIPADVPFPFSSPATPVDSILEARRALPRTPRGPQAGFLNFVTFKFKHSHLLRSPPPQCLCAFCQCRSCPFPLTDRSSFSRSFSVFLLSLLFYRSFITSLRSFHYPYAHIYPSRIFFRDAMRERKHDRTHVSTKGSRNRTIYLIN